jgi:transcriptional antiterminator NusG
MSGDHWMRDDRQEPLQPGQAVRVINGPFADLEGVVDNVNQKEGKVLVRVSFFGRDTPMELDVLHVERLV